MISWWHVSLVSQSFRVESYAGVAVRMQVGQVAHILSMPLYHPV